MKKMWLACLGIIALSANAQAETIPAPRFNANDTWTYQTTVENHSGWHQSHVESSVLHLAGDSLAVSNKPVGSTMPPTEKLVGADWSRSRSINGRDTLVNRPLAFPLSVGKSWTVDYTEEHPNREFTSRRWHTTYKVVGWDDVTVPAGTFNALKIEAENDWSGILAPAITSAAGTRVDAQGAVAVAQSNRTAPGPISGRTYKAFWYVPSVKRWAKSVEEYYDPNGVRVERYTDELEAFKPAN